jgi:PadR family transcriptional regulator, regulatory protein AphA
MLALILIVNNMVKTMTQNRDSRNPADYPVLGMLCSGAAHGYDLCRDLKERLGEIWTLRTSHIYALLAGLEKDGLVLHERVDQETRPAKKVFRVTDKGREVFLAWARSPVINVRDMRLEFLAKLHFAQVYSPAAVTDLIDDQLSVCRENVRRVERSRRSCKTATERAALDYRLAMIHAVIDWLLTLGEPRAGSPGITSGEAASAAKS